MRDGDFFARLFRPYGCFNLGDLARAPAAPAWDAAARMVNGSAGSVPEVLWLKLQQCMDSVASIGTMA